MHFRSVAYMYRLFFKRVFDFFFAICAILVLIPLFVIIAIAIKLDSKGPVFFIQNRLGKGGTEFGIIKFRSMTYIQSTFNSNVLFQDDPRITKVGRFIRKTSIDEIPQIINIIRGEMSFIGPRPPVTTFPKRFEEYSDFEKRRFDVRPGISGLAAIRCREEHDWNINIPIDVEYVNNLSLLFDTKLFLLSLLVFFKTDNVYRRGAPEPKSHNKK